MVNETPNIFKASFKLVHTNFIHTSNETSPTHRKFLNVDVSISIELNSVDTIARSCQSKCPMTQRKAKHFGSHSITPFTNIKFRYKFTYLVIHNKNN